MTLFRFTYQDTPQAHLEGRARLGELVTPHGTVQTPAFIFCATKAAIKAVTPQQMKEAGTQFILSNTYHLMLQPGAETVQALGGLHRFCGWQGPMLTDSGGFQIFSLGHGSVADEIKGRRQTNRAKSLVKITEEGAAFRSYINGEKYLLTPERSIEIQRLLGPDFVVVLDECTPFHVNKDYTARSMHMSHRWGVRSLKAFQEKDNGQQKLYGIIQGGIYPDLRKESCDFVNDQPFFGHAIGGSLGATKDQMDEVVAMAAHRLERSRPIHLLGIGSIRDIFNGVLWGIDTFDCVHPTRLARHGGALVKRAHRHNDNDKANASREHLNLNNSRFRQDPLPLEPDCACSTCQVYSRGYIHHLLKAKELLAYTLITIHNVYFMNKLMLDIREALRQGALADLRKTYT